MPAAGGTASTAVSQHPFAMFEQPLAVAAKEVDLVLAAFLAHRLEVLDRMRSGHFRDEFGEQVRFGLRPIEHFVARRNIISSSRIFCAPHMNSRACLFALVNLRGGSGRRLLRSAVCIRKGSVMTISAFCILFKDKPPLPEVTLSCIKRRLPAALDLRQIARGPAGLVSCQNV